MADITDGLSNTYLLGEKYINPDDYADGLDDADNENLYVGYDNDQYRTTDPGDGPPSQDQSGYSNAYIFGSAHPGGFNMAFCDGSVRSMSFSINSQIHRFLGNRKDGQPVDASKF